MSEFMIKYKLSSNDLKMKLKDCQNITTTGAMYFTICHLQRKLCTRNFELSRAVRMICCEMLMKTQSYTHVHYTSLRDHGDRIHFNAPVISRKLLMNPNTMTISSSELKIPVLLAAL